MGKEDDSYYLKSDPSVSPRYAVITALSHVRDTDPTNLGVDLYEQIELEALDKLLLHCPSADISITFSLLEKTITVWIDRQNNVIVEVERQPE